MIEYFDESIIKQAKDHARLVFPNESCGFIVDNGYISCENKSPNPEKHFKIGVKDWIRAENRGEIKAVIHSHNNYAHASKQDMIIQAQIGIPWGIIDMKKGSPQDPFFWGDTLPIADLVERPFIHGVYDCYALLRDYHRINTDPDIMDFPRELDWWEYGESMLLDGCRECGFDFIDASKVKTGDVFFAAVLSKTGVPNHSGVILDRGLILHHLWGRLSRREPMGRWNKYITHYLRYVGK